MGKHPVPPRDVHNPNASPEALSHNPGLHSFRPTPIATTRLQWKKAGLEIGKAGVGAKELSVSEPTALCEDDIVLPDVRIGAPPDYFNEQGQDWGLAPLSPVAMAASNRLCCAADPARLACRAALRGRPARRMPALRHPHRRLPTPIRVSVGPP